MCSGVLFTTLVPALASWVGDCGCQGDVASRPVDGHPTYPSSSGVTSWDLNQIAQKMRVTYHVLWGHESGGTPSKLGVNDCARLSCPEALGSRKALCVCARVCVCAHSEEL